MKLILVRHGKDDDRYRGGWSSLDLTAEGVKQAKQLAKYLKNNKDSYKITQIISSDLLRTITTANYISSELKIPVKEEARIREINNGDLAGLPNNIADVLYPGLYFSSLEMDETYPNGESPDEFYSRIKKWFSEISSGDYNGKGNLLVVTHGGVINVIYHLVKGIEWNNKRRTFKADNCSIHILNIETMKFEVENRKVIETGALKNATP